MSLGVLNNIAAIYAQNNLNQTQNSLQNVLQQLSSGSRINSGADDAAGLALADGLHANETALMQSAQNASSGVGLLQTADGALSQVTNLLNRAVTLATEAANGTLNPNQIGSANQEYQNILTEIGIVGSTTNFNGNTVFTNTATSVFVSDGTATGSTTYSEVIGNLSNKSVGTTAAAASTTLANPVPVTTTAITPTAVAAAGGGTAVAGVSSFTLGVDTDTMAGGFSVSIGGGAAITDTFATGTTLAAAVTQLNANVAFSGAGLVASQGTGANSNKLIITGPTGAANTLDLSASTINDETTPAAVTAATDTAAADAPGATAGTETFALAAATDTISGTLKMSVAGGAAVSVTLATGTTLANAVTQLNADAGFSGAGLVASVGTGANAGNLIITGPAGATNTIDTTGTALSDEVPGTGAVTGSGKFTPTTASDTLSGTLSVAVNGGTAVTETLAAGTTVAAAVAQMNADTAFTGAGLTASVGTGADAGKLIISGATTDTLDFTGSTITDTGTAGPGVDFSGANASLTAANAHNVLTSITSAIQDIDYQRGNIGASINELNAASGVASAESVNLTAAEDSIRSTNYGQATSDMAKFQVLSQTGIAALAQANSVQQEILKLLQ